MFLALLAGNLKGFLQASYNNTGHPPLVLDITYDLYSESLLFQPGSSSGTLFITLSVTCSYREIRVRGFNRFNSCILFMKSQEEKHLSPIHISLVPGVVLINSASQSRCYPNLQFKDRAELRHQSCLWNLVCWLNVVST